MHRISLSHQGGSDRPLSIILRDRTMILAKKKSPNSSPLTSEPSSPTLQRPRRRVAKPRDTARGLFLTKPEIRPRGDQTWDLKVLLISLNHYATDPFAESLFVKTSMHSFPSVAQNPAPLFKHLFI
jgi:hypothetical protein